MLWLKAFHIIFMVTWFAGLFYLPRLYVYHAMADDGAGIARFKVMERKLFYGIMTPGGVLTVISGLWLWLGYGFSGGWVHAQIALGALLLVFYGYFGKLVVDFKDDRKRPDHGFYRLGDEISTLLLLPVFLLFVVKPFL